MEDIEHISLVPKIWLREFETMSYLLMIKVVPYPFPTLGLCLDLHLPIVSFTQHHPWHHYMIFPSLVVLALHILSLIRPGRVWRVWAQGWSCMVRDGLWSLGGLLCEDWSIAWWDSHSFCHEYRDWSCMMRVGLWWAVVHDEIIIDFALRRLPLRLLWSIWSMV